LATVLDERHTEITSGSQSVMWSLRHSQNTHVLRTFPSPDGTLGVVTTTYASVQSMPLTQRFLSGAWNHSCMVSSVPTAPRRVLPLGIASVVAFVALATIDWHRMTPLSLDARLTNDLVGRPASGWFRIGDDISLIGSGGVVVILAVIAAALLWRVRRDVIGAVIVIGAAGAGGVGEVVAKALIARPRPATMTFTGESGFGFPSGHTTGFTALAVGLALVLSAHKVKAWHWAAAAGLSVAVAIGRVAVGAHYVFDVLAGLAFGTAVAVLVHALVPVALAEFSRRRSVRHASPPTTSAAE
jgi:membrane-associated phospholipid phosphatase